MLESYYLYIVLGSIVLLAAVLLVVFLSSFRKSGGGARSLEGDLASMMILFQTMRDMLEQQKDLARQLNESVDRKVDMIRKVVRAAADAHDELCQAQRAMAEHLRQTRNEMEQLRQRASSLAQEGPQDASLNAARPPLPDVPRPAPLAQSLKETSPVLDQEEADFIDYWVGLEVAQAEPEPPVVSEEPAATPVSDEETHAARDAFRMLLNMATAAQTPVPDAPAAPKEATHAQTTPVAAEPGSNGHDDHVGGNRELIYEYSDAGMSVSDIARELGMGKGEVRLILGLRKEEDRKV